MAIHRYDLRCGGDAAASAVALASGARPVLASPFFWGKIGPPLKGKMRKSSNRSVQKMLSTAAGVRHGLSASLSISSLTFVRERSYKPVITNFAYSNAESSPDQVRRYQLHAEGSLSRGDYYSFVFDFVLLDSARGRCLTVGTPEGSWQSVAVTPGHGGQAGKGDSVNVVKASR